MGPTLTKFNTGTEQISDNSRAVISQAIVDVARIQIAAVKRVGDMAVMMGMNISEESYRELAPWCLQGLDCGRRLVLQLPLPPDWPNHW